MLNSPKERARRGHGRRMTSRAWVPVFIAASAATCAPTHPTPSTTTSAKVHAVENLSFPSCSSDGRCLYQGFIFNDGPDCASNVRGITHLFDASGHEIEAQQWEIGGRVLPTQSQYNG